MDRIDGLSAAVRWFDGQSDLRFYTTAWFRTVLPCERKLAPIQLILLILSENHEVAKHKKRALDAVPDAPVRFPSLVPYSSISSG